MLLNEADSRAACRRGARTRETQLLPRGHGPGSASLSEMSSPRHRASAPLLPAGDSSGALPGLCGGSGALGLFLKIFEGSLKSPCNNWISQPCSAGAPFHPRAAGEAPQAQLENHLCTSSAPGTAVKTTQGTAGRVISAQLALVGLPQERIQPQGPGVGLLRAGQSWPCSTVVL